MTPEPLQILCSEGDELISDVVVCRIPIFFAVDRVGNSRAKQRDRHTQFVLLS